MSVENFQISPTQLKQEVDKAITTHDFTSVMKDMQASEKGKNPQQQGADLQAYRQIINQELKANGFPDIDLKLDNGGNMHVVDGKGKDLDQHHFAEKTAQTTEKTPQTAEKTPQTAEKVAPGEQKQDVKGTAPQGGDDYWKQHERQDNKDGSSDITVKKGDSMWKIAEKLCEQKLGHKMDPKNLKDMQAVLKMTKDLAKAQDPPIDIDKNGRAMIKDGDSIHVPKELNQKAGDKTDPTDKQNPDDKQTPGDKPSPHAGHHGKVENNGNTTTVTHDSGDSISVARDDKGQPNDVSYNMDGKKGHMKKTGDHEWTDDDGTKYNGDVTMDKKGNYTFKDSESGSSYTEHPDGSSQRTDENGKPSEVKSADGPHKHTYTKGDDGKWAAQPGGEKFDDVSLGKDDSVVAKVGNTTKTMYPDGSQQDTDEKGNATFIQSPDGKHQQSYLKGADGKFTANPSGEKFDDVKLNDDGTTEAKGNGVTKKMYTDGRQVDTDDKGNTTFVQSPDGKHQQSYLRGADGKFTASPSGEKFDDVKVDDDGTTEAKGNGVTKKMYTDGRQVDTDDKGNQTFVQSGDGAHQHGYTKGADGKWTAQPGNEKFDDVKMGDDGTVTGKSGDITKTMYPDGRQVDTDSKGNETFIQSPDGSHQDSYTKGADGKWHSANGKEELTDVKMDDKGDVVTSDAHGMTKYHYTDGSQVDMDGHDRMTYMRTKEGTQYNMTYNYDDSTVPQTVSDSNGNNYNLDTEGRYYTNTKTGEAKNKLHVSPGGITIEGAKGKTNVAAGDGQIGADDQNED